MSVFSPKYYELLMSRDRTSSIFSLPQAPSVILDMCLKHGKPPVHIFELFITVFHVEFVPDSYSDTLAETTMASCRLPVAMTSHS